MTLAALLLKVTITLVLALAVARAGRQHRAAVRHLWLAAAFAVILALPLASMVIPSIRVELPVAATGTTWSPIDLTTTDPDTAAVPASATPGPALVSASRASSISMTTLLLWLWVGGAAACLAIMFAALWQVRAIRRSGLPWRDGQTIVDGLAADAGIRRRVTVLLHEWPRGPMTCGIFQPAIVLPITAASWPSADLQRAVVHELEHVRRGDWLSQCLARIVCAAYWFHPLIWIANRQLCLEAERACDDAVLRRSEAVAYADQLVDLARALSAARHSIVLGMANRTDLSTRVSAVLDRRQRRGRAGTAWIGLACVATLILVATISPLRLVAVAAQTPSTDQGGKFEVVSIKPCASEPMPPTGPGGRGAGPSNASVSPGRVYWSCITTDQLIQTAYTGPDTRLQNSLTRQRPGDPQIVRNGPSWVYSDKFEVEVKATGTPEPRTMTGPMLRALLEERFALKTHRATEERSMYQLTVAPGGLKIRQTAADECREYNPAAPTPPPAGRDQVSCGNLHMSWNGGNRTLTSTGTTMQAYTDGMLSGSVMDRFVINKTGLEGRYYIPLEFAPDDNTPGGIAGLAWSRREGAIPPTAPTIFTALLQLGLKLEPVKATAEYLVIDRIEKPKGGGQ